MSGKSIRCIGDLDLSHVSNMVIEGEESMELKKLASMHLIKKKKVHVRLT